MIDAGTRPAYTTLWLHKARCHKHGCSSCVWSRSATNCVDLGIKLSTVDAADRRAPTQPQRNFPMKFDTR